MGFPGGGGVWFGQLCFLFPRLCVLTVFVDGAIWFCLGFGLDTGVPFAGGFCVWLPVSFFGFVGWVFLVGWICGC